MTALPQSPLVTTEWLASAQAAPSGQKLVVFDASFYLPTEHADPNVRFAEGHIPGARFFDLEAISDLESDLPHMVPSQGKFERMVGALGVSTASIVVFYDQKGLFSAARGWWLMRLFGHDLVYVLDGGLPKWVADGHATEQGPPAPAAPGVFHADFRPSRLRGLGDMRSIVADGSALVLDARAAGRFTGATPEPRPGLPGGHMPGAVSLPASALLAPDQTMLPKDALRARFAQAGVDGSRPVVTSCGTGVTAAILTMGMVAAGLPEGALYDGSWTEWASREDTPKVTGDGTP